MTPRELEEYRALRATIRERGTARVWIVVGGLVGWAGLVVATASLATLPVATLLPLLVLAGTFEAVFALHVGVERVGRYLQVFFEDQWEAAAMAFGRTAVGGPADPMFAFVFIVAALVNFVPVLVAEPAAVEVEVIGAAHLVVVARILVARRYAGRQRALDLERFQKLKAEGLSAAPARS
jgi:hypothetical protein